MAWTAVPVKTEYTILATSFCRMVTEMRSCKASCQLLVCYWIPEEFVSLCTFRSIFLPDTVVRNVRSSSSGQCQVQPSASAIPCPSEMCFDKTGQSLSHTDVTRPSMSPANLMSIQHLGFQEAPKLFAISCPPSTVALSHPGFHHIHVLL